MTPPGQPPVSSGERLEELRRFYGPLLEHPDSATTMDARAIVALFAHLQSVEEAGERVSSWPREQEPYDGEHCQMCGASYATVYHVPDDVWRRISPKGNEGGLLCPPCAACRAHEAGIDLWWEAAENEFPTARLQGAEEALRHYADEDTWVVEEGGHPYTGWYYLGGNATLVARAALTPRSTKEADGVDSSHRCDELEAEAEQLREALREARQVAETQAEDEGLWFVPQTAPEAYLQQELRRLHAVIESDEFALLLSNSQAPPIDDGDG